MIWYPLVAAQVVLFSFADEPGQNVYKKLHKQENSSPENMSSFLNRQTLWWFTRICAVGAKKPLELSDLYNLNPDDTSSVLVPRWTALWDPAIQRFMNKKKAVELDARNLIASRRVSMMANGDAATWTTPLLVNSCTGVVRY